MSKAVLVMDMPEDCGDCPFVKFVNGHFVCQLKKKLCGNVRKPDWCPLRPMPEKKDVLSLDGKSGLSEWNINGQNRGWNACIDAIGGVDGD